MNVNSDIPVQKFKVSADIINQTIADILIDQNPLSVEREHNEGFINQFVVIKNAFERDSDIGLQKLDIAGLSFFNNGSLIFNFSTWYLH